MKYTLKIWFMLIILALSIIMIFNFQGIFSEGVLVKEVERNTTVFDSGLRAGEIIVSINNQQVRSFNDYISEINSIFNTLDEEKRIEILTKDSQYVFFTTEIPEITVSDIPKTNIRTGLDIQGGARALVKPEEDISKDEMQDLISVSTERLNVYGITDIKIRPVSDLSGNSFMLIEIAGATPNDIENLISQQGKFEAKIGNETVFTGGNNDLTYVCRNDASCSSVVSCQDSGTGWFCNYQFTVHLSADAAKKHADVTRPLGMHPTNPGYLDEQMDFFLDDVLTNSLFISENLQGQVTTQIQIQGSGSGIDRESAFNDAEASMKRMQTVLITGSLPYKLEIVKLDTISPLLGQKFIGLILFTAVAALVSVAVVVFFRYKKFKASLALLFTSFSELVILLGVASLIRWNLDLPSIVGILVMVGTGVDQQIIILDESLSKGFGSLTEKMKGALFIVIAAYFTTFFSLLPLFWAGAGLLQGFAVTTLIGLTIGVLITRPAFADMLKMIDKKDNATP